MTSLVEAGRLRSFDPATLEPLGSVPVASADDVHAAVRAAAAAQERWARTTHAERRRVLERAAGILLERIDELAQLVTAEVGKPLVEAYGWDVVVSLDTLRWLARHAGRELRPERIAVAPFLRHKRPRVEHEPLGVAAVVGPWNLPLSIPFTQAAFAVAAGNAVVVKPSELAPLTGDWVVRAFAEAGAPEGLVAVVQGGGDVGEALVAEPDVATVLFTGSVATGRRVAAAAAARPIPIPVVLELSGKDPMLVFADADLDRAVEGALWGAFSNCGQVCVSVERVYVEEPAGATFAARLAERARALRLGPGSDPCTEVGPLASEGQRAHVERLVAEAVERGGAVLAGGRRPEGVPPGWFFEPTVLADAEIDEEVFGPVVTVGGFADEDDAVRLANASPYALGASVWTRDRARARRVGARLEAGLVWTNDSGWSYAAAGGPWGGTKASGFGSTHSRHGLYAVTRRVLRDADTGRLRPPWWFPYAEGGEEAFRALAHGWYGRDARAAWRGRRALLELARRYRRTR